MSEQLLKPVITDTGITALINARNSGVQARIVKIQIGDGNGASYTPEATTTALKNKIQEVAVSGAELIGQKNNQLHITATVKDVPIPDIDLPDSYAINEIGFLLDTGELFALYSPGANQKIADKVKGTDFLLAFDLILTGKSAENVVIDGTGDLDQPAAADNILLGSNTIKIHTQAEFDTVFNQGADTVVPANSTVALSPIKGMYQPDDTGRWKLLHEIIAFADSTTEPGTKVTCISAAHGLSEGEAILILQSQHHDGNYSVSNVTANTFDILATFVATGTAKWGATVTADITVFAASTNAPVTETTCSSTAHSLSVGDTLLITESYYYNGVYTLTTVSTDSFDIDTPCISGDINDGAWGGTGDAAENTFNSRPAYILKNSVILSESVSIIGFNQEDTVVIKDTADTKIKIQGSSGAPVSGIHLRGWSFDGRGDVDGLGGTLTGSTNGGAFYLDYCERSELNCKIINHMTNADGGGVYGANAVKQITATQLHHNSAVNGGGVVNCDDSTLTVYNCSATTSGSGVEACDNALLRLFNCEAANSTGGVVLEDNGNVGIGTATPQTTLDVNGDTQISGNNSVGGILTVTGAATLNGVTTFNSDVTVGDGKRINIEEIRALDIGGLKLVEEGGTTGIFIEDGGNVGIGTATPQATLHVNGGAQISGTLNFGNSVRQMINLWESGSTTFGIGVQGSTQYFRSSQNFAWYQGGGHDDNALNAGTGGIVQMVINAGKVGIGTTNPEYPLHVAGFASKNVDSYGFLSPEGGTGKHTTNTNAGYSIYAERRIRCPEFNAISDARIKQIEGVSDRQGDLAMLLNLEVTDYYYTDKLQYGDTEKKGLIAQQVEQIFPQAIQRSTDFIPDIFTLASATEHQMNESSLRIRLADPHDLQVGDKIRLIVDGPGQVDKEIIAVADPHSFTVGDWTEPVDKVFVHGKQVDDFRTIDYDRILMLCLSALQEHDWQNKQLQAEKEALVATVEDLKQGYDDLKAGLAALKNA